MEKEKLQKLQKQLVECYNAFDREYFAMLELLDRYIQARIDYKKAGGLININQQKIFPLPMYNLIKEDHKLDTKAEKLQNIEKLLKKSNYKLNFVNSKLEPIALKSLELEHLYVVEKLLRQNQTLFIEKTNKDTYQIKVEQLS